MACTAALRAAEARRAWDPNNVNGWACEAREWPETYDERHTPCELPKS